MIKVSKTPEVQRDVISVLSIVKVKGVPFQVCATLSFHTNIDVHAITDGVITKNAQFCLLSNMTI